ncbi:MAG: hypothetical protein N3A69_07995, partial [Leptospiraceae bacterium]|nr:hypothetical protein [Leptospiraceae bacterium]
KVCDPEKIVFVLDHYVPNKDVNSAENCKLIKEFVNKFRIQNLYEGSEGTKKVFLRIKDLIFT